MGGDLCQIWDAQHFYSMYQDHAVIQYSTRQAQYANMHVRYANTQAQYAILKHAHNRPSCMHNRPSCMHNMLIMHAQYTGHNLSYISMWYMNVMQNEVPPLHPPPWWARPLFKSYLCHWVVLYYTPCVSCSTPYLHMLEVGGLSS